MKKVVHVHGDHKFITETEKFEGELFENQLIILDSRHEHNQKFHDKALFFPPEEFGLSEILEEVNKANILVVYALDNFKARIINGTKPGIKIIWRFFGNELYSRKLGLYLDDKTRSYFSSEILKSRLKSDVPFFFAKEKSFRSAIKKIDLIAGIFEEEYEVLTAAWPILPKFVQLPLQTSHDLEDIRNNSNQCAKRDVIVIGNSRSYFNNHLEILDTINGSAQKSDVKFQILFNYGKENQYTAKIRETVKVSPNIELVEDFIPMGDFLSFYDSVSAMVNNSYRQLGLGNILLSLRKGVKVYLNPKSPTYNWLVGLGFKVFSTDNLKKDLKRKSISLTKSESAHNLQTYQNVLNNYTNHDFQSKVYELVYE